MTTVDVELAAGINLFCGDNGAGKTTLLETITSLSRGRISGQNPRECAGSAGADWSIDLSQRRDDEQYPYSDRLRMRWQGSLELTVNGEPVTARTLSRQLIVAAIEPRSHDLFDFGPSQRRRFLDWTLFHVEPEYGELWAKWRRILSQRNEVLANRGSEAAIGAWDGMLAEVVERIDGLRRQVVEDVASDLRNIVPQLLELDDVSIQYKGGWNSQHGYLEVLKQTREADVRAGRTRQGPQRADLEAVAGDRPADKLSRGQQKLLIAALMVSASRHVARARREWPVLMIDDFEAELGSAAKSRLAALLADYPGQSLVTQHEHVGELQRVATVALFHVEHGQIHPAIQ